MNDKFTGIIPLDSHSSDIRFWVYYINGIEVTKEVYTIHMDELIKRYKFNKKLKEIVNEDDK